MIKMVILICTDVEKLFITYCHLEMNEGAKIRSWSYAFFNIILVLKIALLVSAK